MITKLANLSRDQRTATASYRIPPSPPALPTPAILPGYQDKTLYAQRNGLAAEKVFEYIAKLLVHIILVDKFLNWALVCVCDPQT